MPATVNSFYPPVGFYFRVTVEGFKAQGEGNFQEVSGLRVKLGTEDIKEGGENRFVHRLPTPPKYENLVLKRGLMADSLLVSWARRAMEQFMFTTKTVVVSLLNDDGLALASWNFVNAYPVMIQVSDFKAQENAIVVETLELCYDYFERIS